MGCFSFSSGKWENVKLTKSASTWHVSGGSNEHEGRGSGSDFNSQNNSDISTGSLGGRSMLPSFPQTPNENLRVFKYAHLRAVTRNFSRSLIVGEGGFGCVYRGTLKSSDEPKSRMEVAVKQLNRQGFQGHKEWVTEVNVLGVVEHPNLVKLMGYCAEDDERGMQRLLVYEFMPNGNLEHHLAPRSATPLPWSSRLRIILDAARGLTYLHEGMEFQIIFRDLKTSNILLDEKWNAKLSDFDLAGQGPGEGLSHVSTTVVGTIGYAAPEYMQTGRLTAKSDIWSFGVVLYEIITGRRPFDRNRPKNEQKLLEWIRPYISDSKKFHMIMDPRLGQSYSLKSAQKLAEVANRCLVRHARARPKMSELLDMIKQIVASEEIGNPQGGPKDPSSPNGHGSDPSSWDAESKRSIGSQDC